MLVLPCRRCSHSYEVGPDEPVERIKCPACGELLQRREDPGPAVRRPRRVAVAALAVLLLLAGGWLAYRWATGPADPAKVEARFRRTVRDTGGEVLDFYHTQGPDVCYGASVAREGYTLDARVVVQGRVVTGGQVQVVRRGRRGLRGDVRVVVPCGVEAPAVKAYRHPPAEATPPYLWEEVTLPKEEETCKRVANDLFEDLKEALR
jgi:hypothetical protein